MDTNHTPVDANKSALSEEQVDELIVQELHKLKIAKNECQERLTLIKKTKGFKQLCLLPFQFIRVGLPLLVIVCIHPAYFIVSNFVLLFLGPKWDNWLFSGHSAYVANFYEFFSGVNIYMHGDNLRDFKDDENVLFLSNHQCSLDWCVTSMVTGRQSLKSLGKPRFVMKREVLFMPLCGIYIYLRGCAFLKRNYTRDSEYLKRLCRWYVSRQIQQWFVFYPEGTRYDLFDEDKIAKSMNHSKKEQWPIYRHVLAPRTKGIQLVGKEMGDTFDAVYDITLAYRFDSSPGRVPCPSMISFLSGDYKRIDIKVKRYDAKQINWQDESLIACWLSQVFRTKDRWLDMVFDGAYDEGHKNYSLLIEKGIISHNSDVNYVNNDINNDGNSSNNSNIKINGITDKESQPTETNSKFIKSIHGNDIDSKNNTFNNDRIDDGYSTDHSDHDNKGTLIKNNEILQLNGPLMINNQQQYQLTEEQKDEEDLNIRPKLSPTPPSVTALAYFTVCWGLFPFYLRPGPWTNWVVSSSVFSLFGSLYLYNLK